MSPVLAQRRKLVVQAVHQQASTSKAATSEKDRGFVADMRKIAMKMHTKDQAPKEGGREASKTPMSAWQPTREGYLQFLAESKAVYDAFESIIATNPAYAGFRNSGLERGAALAKDLQWFETKYNMRPPALTADGPGLTYAKLVKDLSEKDPPAFICHFYNFYFAHTAGGRMIGSKLSSMLLENAELGFYKWEGDVQTHLEAVRKQINDLAEHWGQDQKTHCLLETERSFKFSGNLMKCIAAGH